MEDYFSLGTDPSLLKEFFKGVEDLPVMKNPEIIFEYLLYMVSAEDFILTEEFEKYFELMLNSKRPFKNPKMFNLNLFYAFLKTKSKEKYSINFFNYAAKHKHILDKKYDQSNSRNFEVN